MRSPVLEENFCHVIQGGVLHLRPPVDRIHLDFRDVLPRGERMEIGHQHPDQAEHPERQERVVDPQAAVRIS
jgi:hypothetical protein